MEVAARKEVGINKNYMTNMCGSNHWHDHTYGWEYRISLNSWLQEYTNRNKRILVFPSHHWATFFLGKTKERIKIWINFLTLFPTIRLFLFHCTKVMIHPLYHSHCTASQKKNYSCVWIFHYPVFSEWCVCDDSV